jgi:hypothetical protein
VPEVVVINRESDARVSLKVARRNPAQERGEVEGAVVEMEPHRDDMGVAARVDRRHASHSRLAQKPSDRFREFTHGLADHRAQRIPCAR